MLCCLSPRFLVVFLLLVSLIGCLVGWLVGLLCFGFGFCYYCYYFRINFFLSLGLNILICKMGHWIRWSLFQCFCYYQSLISLFLAHTSCSELSASPVQSGLLQQGPDQGHQPVLPKEHGNGGPLGQLQGLWTDTAIVICTKGVWLQLRSH